VSKQLSRRAVLRGMGTALALPLLDAMAPVQTTHRADRALAAAHDIAYGIYLKLFSIRNEIETEAKLLDGLASAGRIGVR